MFRKSLFFALLCLSLLLLLAGCRTETELPPTRAAAAVPATPARTVRPSPTQSIVAATLPAPVSVETETEEPLESPVATETLDPSEASPPPSPSPAATTPAAAIDYPAGSLLSLRLNGRVGVLLDDFPEDQRDRAAEALMDQPEEVWRERATRQVELTHYRLHFRDFIYNRLGIRGKKQLPLPPRDLWLITLNPEGPQIQEIDGHTLVTWRYRFSSTLLSDAASPGVAEPALSEIGGVWEEPFILPADPTLLLQRTGNACLNEAGFPPNSYDSENVATFFDYSCQSNDGGLLGCHRTSLPQLSCDRAMELTTGRIATVMRFERLDWDDDLAAEVRRGEINQVAAPDLAVVEEELDNHRIVYRYFPSDSCAIEEACVGGSGWRRLLLFDATVHNIGLAQLDIGLVEAEDPTTNLFEYNACHNHIHYSNYGDFILSSIGKPAKQAFCVESTSRLSNNEFSPLTHSYTCRNQGIQAGWVDEYGAGLDCQWIDITDLPEAEAANDTANSEPATSLLTFVANPDRLLCEGRPVLDENGNQVYEFSGQYNANEFPILFPACNQIDDWDANNEGTRPVVIPAEGSFVTEPCAQGETGPLRNCDFSPVPTPATCEPGTEVTLTCRIETSEDPLFPQVVRGCETSALLGTGTACTYNDALVNWVIGATSQQTTVTCPAARDGQEPGGRFSFYSAPLLPGDPSQPVFCEIEPGD